jgi:hypothetical protein
MHKAVEAVIRIQGKQKPEDVTMLQSDRKWLHEILH